MKNTNKAKILLASAFFIWGSIGIFVKMIPLNSGVVAFDRSLVGMLFLIAVKALMHKKVDIKGLNGNLLELCINGALLGLNGPMLVVLVSPLVFKERLTIVKILWVATALFGVVCVSGVFEQSGVSSRDLIGVAFGVSAAVVYAITVVINKRLDKIDPIDKAVTQFASSTVVMFIYCLFTTKASELEFSVQTIILMIVVGVVHTGVTYTLYFKSLPNVTSQNVAIFAYIDPVVAVVLSALVLREELTVSTIVGAVLVIASAVFSEIYDNQQKKRTIQG